MLLAYQMRMESLVNTFHYGLSNLKTIDNDGNGDYLVLVDKSKAPATVYSFNYHCKTADGGHTGTDISSLQNQ